MTIRLTKMLPLLLLAIGISPLTTAVAQSQHGQAEAIFAGGCFWCMESAFDPVDGVISTTSGYTGGHLKNPTYRQVGSGRSGHAEALKVVYDPDKVSYQQLLDVFWVNIDPTDDRGQFCDHGSEYRSEIFYIGEAQRRAAEASLAKLKQDKPFRQPIVTRITRATPFYRAEHYHQDYYQKNPLRYRYYRYACGRDARLSEIWGERAAPQPLPQLEPTPEPEEESGLSSWFSGFFGLFSSSSP